MTLPKKVGKDYLWVFDADEASVKLGYSLFLDKYNLKKKKNN